MRLDPFLMIDGNKSKGGYVMASARSFTTKDTRYTVKVEPDGSVSCTCPDFQHRHERYGPHIEDGSVCKHIAEFRETLKKEHGGKDVYES